MDDFRAAMERIKTALIKAARHIVEFWQRNRHWLQPLITAERGRRAKAAWKAQSRIARVLSRHPDLAPVDGYLDNWYPGIIGA